MYGLGNIVKKLSNSLLHKDSALGAVPMRSDVGNAFELEYVPLSKIFTDESNFQNRGDKFSERSVNSIINAVENGTFKWYAFDPVLLWKSDKDGKLYVLSGHSRTQAFRRLSKMYPDMVIDGLTFNAIPAKIFKGSFEDAKNLALNSNTLATPETLTERAEYYRKAREKDNITGGNELKELRKKALRENNGSMIWDLSYLPQNGVSLDTLKSFKLGEESGSTENFLRLATICQWIGKVFQIYKGLSTAHDREIFNFLMGGGYGSKSGQYFNFSALNDRLQKLYNKNVAIENKKNARGEYTEPFQIAAYKKDDSTIETLENLKKEADSAYKELKSKFKELRENNATREQIFEIATPYFNQWANKLYAWWQLLDRVPKQDNTPSLFGLGRVNPKLYFNDRLLSDRMFQLATRIAEQAESAGLTEPQEIRNLIDTQIELKAFSDWQEDDAELLGYLKKKVQNPYLATNVENVNTTPVRPSADDVRFSTRKWNRWARVQKLWGDFIEALKLLVEPRNLVSDYFKTIIVYNSAATNTEKTFKDIASALDFAFEKGHLLKHNWYIINDKNKSVINYSDIPESLNGLFYGIFGDGLGKPTIKFEFETNDELKKFLSDNKDNLIDSYIDVDAEEYNDDKKKLPRGVSGLTVNDKPAAVFNCSESELQTQGYKTTYKRLKDYSSLIDVADGAKTLKGYGFDNATLTELLEACKKYKQVEKLAKHLKASNMMQSAFNVWHWLHTNIKYNFDSPGAEEIRTPARTWLDRDRGVDCDCLAVFTACLFLNMGYAPKFEIVAFNNSPTYSHIYVNLNGAAIDRVLPVFLARPGGITKTKIMDIPVYELSGCRLNGLYESTLSRVQQGTASADDVNNFRKTQILLTLRGLDDDLYNIAALLMPHVISVTDDGKYYFDSQKAAEVAKKADAQIALLKQQGIDDNLKKYLIKEIIDELDGVDVVNTTSTNDDTIILIINPQGQANKIQCNMYAVELPTLCNALKTTNTENSNYSIVTQDQAQEQPTAVHAATTQVTQQAPAQEAPTQEAQEKKSSLGWLAAIIATLGATLLFSKK